ncbi:hypothetical protein JW921_07390 [Candidatus Fermentibacterales bacterium]|nr:hypothetical protein [Candidatus Fermentibacterales bacterium]
MREAARGTGRHWLFAVGVCLLACRASIAGFLPLDDPLGIWLHHGEAAGLLPLLAPIRPFGMLSGRYALEATKSDGAPEPGGIPMSLIEAAEKRLDLTLLSPSTRSGASIETGGSATVEALDASGFEQRAGIRMGIEAALLPGLELHEQMSLWTGSDDLAPSFFPSWHQGSEPGRHLYVDWAFLDFGYRWLELSFGRKPQQWGPGRFTQLMLSDNSPGIDMLWVQYALGDDASFTGLTGSVDSDSGTWLTAHRLDMTPWPFLRIGLSEALLYSATGIDLAYTNPFIPWYPVQWNEREDDNAFLGIDATFRPADGLLAYGELLIDDIQYQKANQYPNKLAWTLGLDGCLRGPGLGAVLEYTRIDRYVYSQRRECNYYLHAGRIIGSALGPDCDRLALSVSATIARPLLSELRIDHTRHGEGDVYEGWPDSVQAHQVFPSGVVEHSTGLTLALSAYPLDWLQAHASASKRWLRNRDNLSGQSDSELDGSIQLLFAW